ncbi:hypothetical protein PMAYCL1PPCAC_09829 [Pristionchus mayeri]|uniref:Nuclear receptor n=1 Tax=Pristionchus mayeri TaxID=1317129 RepID=A0AAN5CE94_9BILA|nr:hypothetical protein PMAYCL1PPCAC_09829 [Pristionchus mayeri]
MSASSSKPYECLICAAPIYNTNLGIDACRACTVFYRRHLNSEKPLLCRKGTNDCFEQNTRPLCRKCRFVRFSVVLTQSTSGRQQTITVSTLDSADCGSDSSDHNSIDLSEENKSDFIDHRSFDIFSSCTRDSPFFDRMKRAYGMLCVVRNCGELGIVEQDEEKQKQGDEMVFYPITHTVKMPSIRILSGGLIQFFSAVFDDFNVLSVESKNYILERAIRVIHSLDGLYRAVHHFPGEDTLTPTYMSYINYHLIEQFAEKMSLCNFTDVLREMKGNYTRSVDIVRACYKRVNPTNEEFLALMGLSLWSNDASLVNDEYMKFVSHNRSAIMSELHKFYTNQGIADYSTRLGDILCLLDCIENNTQRSQEDITMIRLMKSLNGDVSDLKC